MNTRTQMGPLNFQAAGRVAAKRRIRSTLSGSSFSVLNFFEQYTRLHRISVDDPVFRENFDIGFRSVMDSASEDAPELYEI